MRAKHFLLLVGGVLLGALLAGACGAAEVVALYDGDEQVGSAVVITPGRALTCDHVVDRGINNEVLARNAEFDLALIEVDVSKATALGRDLSTGSGVKLVAFFDGSRVEINDAIVNDKRCWVDTPLREGMSGGALEDINGRLVGVLVGVDGWDDDWFGAYVPVSTAREFLKENAK